MYLLQRLSPLVLGLLATSFAHAQTWISKVPEGLLYEPTVAVSDLGMLAISRPLSLTDQTISILNPDGSEFSSFGFSPSQGGQYVQMKDVLFLDRTTVAVCGSLGGKPYAGAFDITTGASIWEKTLTADGSMAGLAINSAGNIIAHGSAEFGGVTGNMLCSMNPTSGGFQWFRSYNPGPSEVLSQEVLTLPGGEMVLVLVESGDLVVLRLTNYGHEVWSKRLEWPGREITKARADLAPDGGLRIAGAFTVDMNAGIFALATDASAIPMWAGQLHVPHVVGILADMRSVVATSDGGMVIGHLAKDPHMQSHTSPAATRLTPMGQVLYTENYGTPQVEGMPDLFPTPDGGFVGVFKEQWRSLGIFRADANGYSGPCQIGQGFATLNAYTFAVTEFSYTYSAYPGAIGSVQTVGHAVDTALENVCRRNGSIGNSFCDTTTHNSTGQPTLLTGIIGTGVGSNVRLSGTQGPAGQFGYFLVGTHRSHSGLSISHGFLCLGNSADQSIGRYNVAGTPMNSIGIFDGSGVFQNLAGTSTAGQGFDVPAELPTIGGVIDRGETWNFQLWHREDMGESNFSNGLSVTF